MSTQYRKSEDVPTIVLCNRIDELAQAVTEGKDSVSREFTMRVPAELDRDADLVLSSAARRLIAMENLLLWILYNHQGGKSEVGQPIRKLLGMGQHDNMSEEQIKRAKSCE